MENSFDITGLIIRNEWVYNYPAELQLKNKIPEGQRVPFGKKIVEVIIGDDVDSNLLSKINKLEERIIEINKNTLENSIFDGDIKKLDTNINEKVDLIKKYSDTGDFEKLTEVKNELSDDLYKKSLISGDNSFSGRNLEQLINEKSQLESLYMNNLDAIYSKSAGIVSYYLDGFEQSLNLINIDKLSIDEVKDITETYNEISSDVTYNGVKIVEDYAWYISCVFNEGQAKDMKIGSRMKIIFKSSEEAVSAKIIKISEPMEGEQKVTYEVNEYVDNYYNIRVADITIVTGQYEGYEVSKNSIIEKDNQKGIFVNKKGIVRYVPIEILAFDENRVIIKNIEDDNIDSGKYIIKLYDEVIKNTKNIKENQKIM
ncbi:MAG: hypothetical protein GX154_07970 [Clostridiales bacterium]|nr:hypothetical protein [Clostridiales bacterium]